MVVVEVSDVEGLVELSAKFNGMEVTDPNRRIIRVYIMFYCSI